jgi:hypothetical protein
MRVLTARWFAGYAAAVSVALVAVVVPVAYVDRHLVPAGLAVWGFSYVFEEAVGLAVPVVGFVLASRRPGNPIGWLFLAAGLALGLRSFSHQYALHALVAAPGSWPAGLVFGWLFNWVWVIHFPMLAFVFLIFPTGHLRSPRWRPAAWAVAGALALATVGALVAATRIWVQPFTYQFGQAGALVPAPAIIVLAALVVGVAALVVRFARSVGEERLQLKWFAAAAVLVVVTLIVTFPMNSAVANVFLNLAFLCLWVAVAIAVLKYRLDDIDVVISKAVLYGSLAVFITAVYAALVAGIGTLAGNQRSPLLAALAAAVVAVAFQPARQWAGRLANRVVYGRRATRIRCWRTSPGASAAPTRPRTCCRRWRRPWRREPAPSWNATSTTGRSRTWWPWRSKSASGPPLRTWRRLRRSSASCRPTPRARWRTCAIWPGASTHRCWPTWDWPQRWAPRPASPRCQ